MTTAAPSRLRVAFLGSGSAGNATAVVHDERCVLVDAGFSARETLRRLEACGIGRDTVTALLLTHEHGDHVRGADVLARRLGIPLVATEGTLRAAGLTHLAAERVACGCALAVAGLTVRSFRTSHDVAEPVGYAFFDPAGGSFALATDTGVLTAEALDLLAECELVGLETNHDIRMLTDGPYPAFLKRRILSDRGHLSNAAAAAALEHLAAGRTRRVVAMHLSRTNNTRRAAMAALRVAAEERSLPLSLSAVDQDAAHLQEPAA